MRKRIFVSHVVTVIQIGNYIIARIPLISVTLTHSNSYPHFNRPPKLEVTKSKGLSTNDISILMQELEGLTSKLTGQEMVYEIAQYVQVWKPA